MKRESTNKSQMNVIPLAANMRPPLPQLCAQKRFSDDTTVSVKVLDYSLLDGAAESPGYDPYNRPPILDAYED